MTLAKYYLLILFKAITIVMLLTSTFSSCQKEDEEVIEPTNTALIGEWVGELTSDALPDINIKIIIKKNGLLETQIQNGEKIADGTWQLGGSSGTTFTCSFTTYADAPLRYNLLGNLDTLTKMTGAWGHVNSQVNGGFWNLSKQ